MEKYESWSVVNCFTVDLQILLELGEMVYLFLFCGVLNDALYDKLI